MNNDNNSNNNQNHLKRFEVLGNQDYKLRYLAMDYAAEFQATVGMAIAEYGKRHPSQRSITVVECGSGTGLTTVEILESDPRVEVVAVDNEPKMMAQARLALDDLQERVIFVEADILSHLKGWRDQSIDVFASALTVHNFPDEYRDKVFTEIARVLKRGGLFVNADKYAYDDLEKHLASLDEQIRSFDVFDAMEINRPDIKQAWTEHYWQDEKTKITESEQITKLEELGFDDIRTVFRKSMEATIVARKK